MLDRGRIAAMLALSSAGACSFGNLRHDEVLAALDGVMQVDERKDPARLSYRDEAPIATWPLRATLLVPLQPLLRPLLGGATATRLDNPSGHARELAEVLGDKATGDLQESADAAARLLQIAALDQSNLNRIVAIDALAKICRAQSLPLLPDLTRAELYPDPETDLWLTGAVEAWRPQLPAARPAAATLDAVASERYLATLARLTQRPLARQRLRTGLVLDLASALRQERQPDLLPATAAALRLALQHAVDWLLLDLLASRDPELQSARLAALDLLHGAGGSEAVPMLLAYVAAPANALERFEDGPMRLRLIHLCGQLDQQRGARAVRLPGREAWEPVSPLQFLCEQVLPAIDDGGDGPFGNPMRLPALAALGCSLQRTIDDDAWVREFYQEVRRGQ